MRLIPLLTSLCICVAVGDVRNFRVPEGNNRVTITFGDDHRGTDTTVKAELRRLMIEAVRTQPGQTVTRSFLVNVRRPQIAGDGEVRLKDREKTTEAVDWDDQLSLEFLGPSPGVRSVDVKPAPAVPLCSWPAIPLLPIKG